MTLGIDLTISDIDALERIADGNDEQFEVIMRRHNQRLFRIARAILRSDAHALDALQNAYIKAFRSLDTLRQPERLGAWLNTVVRNEALMVRRRLPRELPIDEHYEKNLTAEEAWMSTQTPGPETRVLTAELGELLEHHIDNLQPDFREVFVLRAVQGLPTREVSELLGVTESTVKTRYFRAREALRVALGGSMDNVYAFDGARCDRVVQHVLAEIRGARRTTTP